MSNKRSSGGHEGSTPAKGTHVASVAMPVGRQGRPSYAQRRAAHERAEQRRKKMTLWGAIGAAVACLVILGLLFLINRSPASAYAAIDDIQCDNGMSVGVHYHQHLRMVANGKEITLPANIGIHEDNPLDPSSPKNCLYWTHTHDTRGIIHVEAPRTGTYTLGTFFKVWGQPLSATQFMAYKTDATHSIRLYVNGKLYKGNPADLPLETHQVLTLEYGPPFLAPKPYTFVGGD